MTTVHLPIAFLPPEKPKPSKAVWVVTSAVFHLGVLALGLIWAPQPLRRDDNASRPTIYVDIEPVVLPREVPARVRPRESAASDSTSPSRGAPTTPVPREARNLPATTGVASSADTDIGPTSQPSNGQWAYRPESTGSAVARTLRTSPIGCDYPERLSDSERAICNERATNRAVRELERGQRITGTGDARRDGALQREGTARLRNFNSRRLPITNDEVGNGRPSDSVGSNLGIGPAGRHLDSSLQPDAYGPVQTKRRDGPPEDRIQRTPH